MRETGIEPAHLSVLDPKSGDRILLTLNPQGICTPKLFAGPTLCLSTVFHHVAAILYGNCHIEALLEALFSAAVLGRGRQKPYRSKEHSARTEHGRAVAPARDRRGGAARLNSDSEISVADVAVALMSLDSTTQLN
jgi:hypothetical protein